MLADQFFLMAKLRGLGLVVELELEVDLLEDFPARPIAFILGPDFGDFPVLRLDVGLGLFERSGDIRAKLGSFGILLLGIAFQIAFPG